MQHPTHLQWEILFFANIFMVNAFGFSLRVRGGPRDMALALPPAAWVGRILQEVGRGIAEASERDAPGVERDPTPSVAREGASAKAAAEAAARKQGMSEASCCPSASS